MKVPAALAALAILAASCATATATPAAIASSAAAPRSDLGEQRHEAGAVTVVASWLTGATLEATVTLDTHSVDLDRFDLKELARVRLDGGAWLAPTSWDAPKGGHHREGTLTFGALDRSAVDAAALIELEVRDVAVPSRILRWERPR